MNVDGPTKLDCSLNGISLKMPLPTLVKNKPNVRNAEEYHETELKTVAFLLFAKSLISF